MDANMADIESGDEFKKFARQKYQSGHCPMPNAAQMDRIAGKIRSSVQEEVRVRHDVSDLRNSQGSHRT